MNKSKDIASTLLSALYSIAVLELFIGGGGRLIEIGPVTLRMLLFAAMVCVICATLLIYPLRKDDLAFSMILVLAFLAIHLPALINGLFLGAKQADIFSDVQPTLYWIAAPFFALALAHRSNIERTRKLVLIAGTVLAASYLGTLLAVFMGYIDPIELWIRLVESGEFFFRNDFLFFYKGHLYLGIAIIFLLAMPAKKPWLLLIISVALILTLTRGFILALSITALSMFIVQRRWRAAFFLIGLISVMAAGVSAIVGAADTDVLGARDDADSQRFGDLRYMLSNASIGTLVFGEGFGSFINERLNIETTYLWLLWKAGIPSLTFWMSPIIFCYLAYRKIPKRGTDYSLASAFMFSVLFIYIQTATNPYLNNPIGLSFVLIAIFSLRQMASKHRLSVPHARLEASVGPCLAGIALPKSPSP